MDSKNGIGVLRAVGGPGTQKEKNEPRRANEQVVGDANFRINKDSKIIIY